MPAIRPHTNLCPTPKSLKLEFSRASDYNRINKVLDPAVKAAFDPEEHAVRRLVSSFQKAVDGGCAAVLSDERGNIKTLTLAYHVHVEKNPAAGAAHDHTNFGTSLSLIPGYKSSSVVIAALALREWYVHPPLQTISAGIVPENAPSKKIYHGMLGWRLMQDKEAMRSAATATWRTLPDPADPTGRTCLEKAPPALAHVDWYDCNDAVIVKQAQVVLEAMRRGCLVNGKTGEKILLDLSALKGEGLTKKRLEAIASGVTSRKKLAKIALSG